MTDTAPEQAPEGKLDQRALGARALRGIGWGTANVGLTKFLQFVATIIAAQLLAPDNFGALAIALTIQMVAMNMSELGATATLGRAQRNPDEVAPTVYTIALVTSVILTALMVTCAPWIAALMNNPEATPVIQVMSITVVLSGISSVPTALLWRDYHQGRRFIADMANVVVMIATMVPMALAGWEAMSLAWSRVAGQLVATVLFLWLAPRLYRPGFSLAEAKPALRLGLPLAASNVVVFITLSVDYVIIGRALTPTLLGIYLLAFNLAALPSTVFTAVIRTVAVPTFGRLHLEQRLPLIVPQVISMTVMVAAPVCAVFAALGGPLLGILYGPEWTGAATAMIGLAVFSVGRVITELLADLLVAMGTTISLFWIQVAWFTALVPATVIGVDRLGIAGAGLAHAVVVFCVVIPLFAWTAAAGSRIPIRVLLAPCLPGLAMAAAAALIGWSVAQQISLPLVQIALGTVTILAVYGLFLWRNLKQSVARLRLMT